jgi:hypothetical protein
MHFKPMNSIIAAVIVGIVLLGTYAKADNFYFSFTDTTGAGYVFGTVTGEIEGLTNNATGPAAEVLLLSFPTAVLYLPGSVPPGVPPLFECPSTSAVCDVSLWYSQEFGFSPNIFTETNGLITYFDFNSFSFNADFIFGLEDGGGFLSLNTDESSVGSQEVVFYPPGPVPEPTSVILMLTVLVGLAFVARMRMARTNNDIPQSM